MTFDLLPRAIPANNAKLQFFRGLSHFFGVGGGQIRAYL